MTSLPLKQQYTRIVEEASALARVLERGQAEAPITELFDQLAAQDSRAELIAVLLPLSPRAFGSVLSWLTGAEVALPLVAAINRVGIVQLAIGGSQWVVENGPRQYQAFDNGADWIKALEQATPTNATLSLQVPGAGGVQPLRLDIVANPGLLEQNPTLLTRLCTTAHLGILSGDMHYQITDQDRRVLNTLAENLPALWPLMTIDELLEDAKPPVGGWWTQFRSSHQQLMPKPVALTTHIKTGLASVLADLSDETRQQLQLRLASRSLQNAIDLLADQHEQRLRQASTRVEREQRAAKAQEPDTASAGRMRQVVQEAKQLLQDHGANLNRQLSDASRHQRGATGQFSAQLSQYLNSLNSEDLRQETTHSQIKLTVDPRFLDNLTGILRNGLQGDCQALSSLAQTELENLRQGLEQRVRSIPLTLELSPASIIAKDIWAPLGEQLAISINYRGSMPKRGIVDRFKEGRQGAMGFMMMGSMAAMIFGGSLRDTTWFGPAIGIIFLGSMAYSIVSWKKDDSEKMEQELERVRDSLQSELQRQLNDTQRELMNRLQVSTDQQRKLWQKTLDAQIDATQKQNQAELDTLKRAQNDRQRAAEKQRSELEGLRSGIARLKRDADALQKE